MRASGAAGLGVDWRMPIDTALQLAAGRVAIQGNLDPTVLLATPEAVQKTVTEQFSKAVQQPGFIFNLGHGIMPQTPPENVAALLASVQALSA